MLESTPKEGTQTLNGASNVTSKHLDADEKLQPPLIVPSKEERTFTAPPSCYFNTPSEAVELYQQGNLSLHQPIWVKCHDIFETGNVQEEPLEIRLHVTGRGKTISCGQQFDVICFFNESTNLMGLDDVGNQYVRTTAGRALVNDYLNLSCLE
jgi:hypothetical protein